LARTDSSEIGKGSVPEPSLALSVETRAYPCGLTKRAQVPDHCAQYRAQSGGSNPVQRQTLMTTTEAEVMNVGASDASMRANREVSYVCVDELRFNRLTADLEASRRVNAYQSLAMATAGHDLRQHVQTILLALDLVRPGLIDEKYLEWLTTAQEQAACLTSALEGLAREANIHAYTAQHKRSSFPIAALLTRIESKWLSVANARNLRLKIDQSAVRVRSNPDLLFVVIDNLVNNAIKHTLRGSVGVYLSVERNTLLVSIQDTGPGIGSENMKAIFQPYWQGTDSRVGMGLGLAIVQNSASILDHQISVNSLVGRGTCFTVHVPVAAATLESA
jgi:signal transduction histidine kinase